MRLVLIVLLLSLPTLASRTRGYVTKRGTYVMPSYKTKADGTKANNYTTKGNINPYTGKIGMKAP